MIPDKFSALEMSAFPVYPGRALSPIYPVRALPSLPANPQMMQTNHGFDNALTPLVRIGESKKGTPGPHGQGWINVVDEYMNAYIGMADKFRDMMHEMTWMKTNPMGMEAMQDMMRSADYDRWEKISDKVGLALLNQCTCFFIFLLLCY